MIGEIEKNCALSKSGKKMRVRSARGSECLQVTARNNMKFVWFTLTRTLQEEPLEAAKMY